MKNIYIKLLLLLFASSVFISCENSELESYSGKDDVFFEYSLSKSSSFDNGQGRTEVIDSVSIRFGYDNPVKKDSIIKIKMRLLGTYVNYNRPINFVLDTSSTAKLGEDIELLHDMSYMDANSRDGYIFVKLINTEKIKERAITAVIKTAPNDHFLANYDKIEEASKYNVEDKMKSNIFRIFYDAKNGMPILWAAREGDFKRAFGTYSIVKFNFICDVLDLNYEYFTYNPSAGEVASAIFSQRFPLALTNGWKLILEEALQKYKDENGEALKDENGEYIIIGGFKP
ncbi:DUF4843 domain-containing protein [Dysgonomonas sp. Marseille-P4677]|uniref:DUF4843 domain-containing protein n=1 Tax=Dysgonomonas sp. Marseille-P4677 TaxID=2364790 RepID=UPI0019141DD4|nr:DUF4843 domain-containing protein [Dysgonomonas sp. Marseille-P4677]MBK5720353.1 DUF4843 domain-containing protein [Dysgonomonas sp. Marseille-P4677]